MIEHKPRFLLISVAKESGRHGFWMADSSENIDVPDESNYTDLWVCTATTRRITLGTPPAIYLSSDPIRRKMVPIEARKPTADNETCLMFRRFAQRSIFVSASNQLSPEELPVFLATTPLTPVAGMQISFKSKARCYWHLPDVRLKIAWTQMFFEDFARRKYRNKPIPAKIIEASNTDEWTRLAHETVLPSGLFLPVTVETDTSVVSAFLQLGLDAEHEEIPATIFTPFENNSLKRNMKIKRNAYFEYLGCRENATSEIGIIS